MFSLPQEKSMCPRSFPEDILTASDRRLDTERARGRSQLGEGEGEAVHPPGTGSGSALGPRPASIRIPYESRGKYSASFTSYTTNFPQRFPETWLTARNSNPVGGKKKTKKQYAITSALWGQQSHKQGAGARASGADVPKVRERARRGPAPSALADARRAPQKRAPSGTVSGFRPEAQRSPFRSGSSSTLAREPCGSPGPEAGASVHFRRRTRRQASGDASSCLPGTRQGSGSWCSSAIWCRVGRASLSGPSWETAQTFFPALGKGRAWVPAPKRGLEVEAACTAWTKVGLQLWVCETVYSCITVY